MYTCALLYPDQSDDSPQRILQALMAGGRSLIDEPEPETCMQSIVFIDKHLNYV